jgi:ABC-type Na+ transport system ATPase subunit NatA
MTPAGDFNKWKECFNIYGQDGLEPYAYAALTAFGSPLLKFTGIRGAAINLISGDSGPGKSTILRVINSVIGKPTELMSMWKDTQNAVARKLAIFNNICHTYDEVTKIEAEDIGSHLYQVTQGRDKERAQASVNQLRSNTDRWELIEIMTSNASLYDKLQIARDSVDGEMMRVFEYVIYSSGLDEQYAKQMFDVQLENNYGHAADIYFSYLVSNKDYVTNMVRSVQAKIDKEVKLTSRERFWSALVACNIAGGLIAKELGLHDFDMRKIYVWVTKQIQILRQHVRPPLDNVSSVIGDYIGRHMQNVLVVNAEVDSRTQMPQAPLVEPKGPLYIRYEPDTKKMFINVKHFKADCARAQITYRELTRKLEENKVLIGSEVKRITKGMKVAAPPVYCLVFDCNSANFFDVEEIVARSDVDTQD